MRIEFKTEERGYIVTLDRDLFGAFILCRRWYGLRNRRGGIKRQVFEDEQEAMRELARVQRLRVRRGYKTTYATQSTIS